MTLSLWALHLREEPPQLLPAPSQVNSTFGKPAAKMFHSVVYLIIHVRQEELFILCHPKHVTSYLNLSLSPHRTCSSHQANRRVQSFPGPSLCSSATAGWFQLWQLRRSPADEAHLWRPAHIHTCASLSRGQRRSCAQRLVKAVISPLLVPLRRVISSNTTCTLNRLRYLGGSATYCCCFFPFKIKWSDN